MTRYQIRVGGYATQYNRETEKTRHIRVAGWLTLPRDFDPDVDRVDDWSSNDSVWNLIESRMRAKRGQTVDLREIYFEGRVRVKQEAGK